MSETFFKGTYKSVATSSSFWAQKLENFNGKNRIYLAFWCVFKDIEHYFHEFVCFKKKFFFEFVCFPRFQNSINDPRKHPNLAKNRKFCQNHQKTTNVGFCDNSFDRSLDMILKYTVSEFFDRKTYFDEITVFWIWKKKKMRKISKLLQKIFWSWKIGFLENPKSLLILLFFC